jgi:hypothetical protein
MDGDDARGGSGKRETRSEKEGRARSHLPPDSPEADVLEQTRDWQGEGDEKRSRVPIDAPEADVLDDWDPGESERPSRVPIDAPEADVMDQTRPADLDDEDRDR